MTTEPVAPADEGAWHRLNPLSPVVRGGRALLALVVIFAPTLFSGGGPGSGHWLDLGVAGAIVALGVVSWLVTRWRVEGTDLRIETGLLRRNSSRFPLRQIQAIDTVRPVLARIFGLAELRLRMGSTSGSGRLAYLSVREAERLRAELLELAHGGESASAPATQPETVLVSVPPSRLIGSILLTRLGLAVEALGVAILVALLVFPTAATAVIGASTAGIFGLLTAFWRRVNGEYNLTLAEASDGLRLRAGLLETTAETIPRGRVQAVRMTEPLLWRPFGWCRLEADIAGRQRKKGENRAQSRQLRALLPVGTREDARRVLGRIVADPPHAEFPAPRSARLKSPLRYHHLAWGRTDSCVVATSGRITRTTAWVPLAKV